MRKPSTFSDVLASYDIIYEPGDLRFTATDIKIGSDRNDAIRILVETWRLAEPQLRELFYRIMVADGLVHESDKSIELAAIESWNDTSSGEQFHEAMDWMHANTLMRNAQAGAMMIILNDMLGNFRRNLKITDHAWESAGQLISQRSVGIIIEAGANSFRHYDEWRRDWNKRKKFRPMQLKSIDVIADVLHVDRLNAARNACFELLFTISRGYWDNLARRLLQYAQAVADHKRA